MQGESLAYNKREMKEILQAKSGNKKAMKTVVERVLPMLQRYVFLRIPNESVPVVLTDITFDMAKKVVKFDPERDISEAAWAIKIARNRVLTFLKNNKVEHDYPLYGSRLEIMADALDTEIVEEIKVKLMKMPPHEREVLELKFMLKLSIKEAAYVIQKSEGDVRVMQLRALRKMR